MLPEPRGPLSSFLLARLKEPPGLHVLACDHPSAEVARAGDEDAQLALYLAYELHYRGLEGVEERWEWEPSLLGFRALLEARLEQELLDAIGGPPGKAPGVAAVADELRSLAADAPGPSLSRYLEAEATVGQVSEFVVHRSLYHLKEADPHSFGIPRLTGRSKAALVEIQADEYGGGRPSRMHSALFAMTLRALSLDEGYGTYLRNVPAPTLRTVNLMSYLGLHRRWRAALAGHLALFEMTSSGPNRRYGNGLRRLGFDTEATRFFDVHVTADAAHELIALNDLVGPLVREGMGADVLFGARALDHVERRFSQHLLTAWGAGASSLRVPTEASLA